MFRLLLLGNGWDDCVEIKDAIGVPLVAAHAEVKGGIALHVRACLYHAAGFLSPPT